MASDADFLTTQKNGVIAINNLNQTLAALRSLLGENNENLVSALSGYSGGSGTGGTTSLGDVFDQLETFLATQYQSLVSSISGLNSDVVDQLNDLNQTLTSLLTLLTNQNSWMLQATDAFQIQYLTQTNATNQALADIEAALPAIDLTNIETALGNIETAVTTDLVDAITNANTALVDQNNYYKGLATSASLTAQTLISAGAGYLVSVTVIDAGTGAGTINNAATTGAAAAANAIVATPTTAGVYPVGSRFTDGLVVTPGTGQSVVVTYSLD